MNGLKGLIFKNRGQAMVEFALVVPILLLLICGIIDFGRIYSATIMVAGAAREGARSAAIGNDDTVVTQAVADYVSAIAGEQLTVNIAPSSRVAGDQITVTVSTPIPVLTPIVNAILGSTYTVSGTAVMRAE